MHRLRTGGGGVEALPVLATVIVAVSRLSPTLLQHTMDHSIPDV